MTTKSPKELVAEVEAGLTRLLEGCDEFEEPIMWDWDRRFSAVVGAASDPDDVRLLELAGALFPHRWDQNTVEQAPEVIRGLAADWGGLRSGQLMFARDADEDPLLFGAWWPWGSGTRFSLRISFVARSAEASEAEPLELLRRTFPI